MTTNLQKGLYNALLIYGCALVTGFFSEMVFFNEGPVFIVFDSINDPLTLILHILELGIWYSFIMAPFLVSITYFNVNTIWPFFLCAFLFGFWAEGLVVPVIYYELPMSIFWTAGSWHPLICILLGWYFLRLVLQSGNTINALIACLGLGIFWGIWSTYLIGNPVDESISTEFSNLGQSYNFINIFDYFVFTLITASIWITGNILIDISLKHVYAPNKTQIISICTITAMLYLLMGTLVGPLIVVLIVASILLFAGLEINRRKSQHGTSNLLEFLAPVPLKNYPIMLSTPIAATCTYHLFTISNISISAEYIAFPLIAISMPMLLISYWKIINQ